jgi:hypothetical protein
LKGLSAHKQTYYQSVARNIFLNEKFFQLRRAFSAENIAAIPLKGIALIQNVYSDISQRYMGDIDVLVKPGDVLKVAVILEGLGYAHPAINFDPRKPYSIYLNSFVFSGHPARVNYSVHLHWHLLNSTLPFFIYRIAMDDIWLGARTERTKDTDLIMLEPHHLLLYLSLHAFHHSFDSPVLLEDIKKVVEFYKGGLDWSEVEIWARRWNACMPLYLTLYFTSRLCAADIPGEMINRVRPDKISKNGQKAIAIILKNGKGWQNVAYPLFLDMADSLRDKAKFIILSLFPPPVEVFKTHAFHSGILLFRHYLKRCGWGILQIAKFLLGSRI